MIESSNVQLEQLFELFGEQMSDRVFTMLPAKVTSYDSSTQTVSIQTLIPKAHVDEDGTRIVENLPEIHGAPVGFLGGAGGRVTVPVAVGDLGLAIFSCMSLDVAKARGGAISDPGDDRRHDLNDAVFLPMLHFGSPPTSAPTNAVVIHGDAKIGGPTATQPTIMGTTYRGAEDAMLTAITAALTALSTALTAILASPLGFPFGGLMLPPAAAACAAAVAGLTAAIAGINSFTSGGASYLTQKAQVK